jgi:SAM-dependent methyltransferase
VTIRVAEATPPEALVRLLRCPTCEGDLAALDGALGCRACGARVPVTEGIPCFAPTSDFYDGYADEGHCPYHRSPRGAKGAVLRVLPFFSWREWDFWRRAVPRCGRLLDVGCGRGRELFVERSREAFGFDASLAFARDCARHYAGVAVGRLPALPFRTGAFDVVVSSHLFGHVAEGVKEELVAEIARVLRPGGVTAHLIETASDHPAVAGLRARPEAYERLIVSQDGHVGLEPAPRVLDRFRRHGFRVRRLRLVDAVVPSLQTFRKYLDHPEVPPWPGREALRRLNRWARRSVLANLAYEVAMGAFHRTVEQRRGDPRRAMFVMVAMTKEDR